MRSILLGATVLLLISTATQAFGQAIDILPPPKFDKPFRGKLEIDRVQTEDDVRGKCMVYFPRILLGCAEREGNTCYIVLASDELLHSYGLDPKIAMRHEIGHCNGWRHED
jgi:hypothetical protein